MVLRMSRRPRQVADVGLPNIRIVLVRPLGSANVGAAARAMKNMGVAELTLVRPAVRSLWGLGLMAVFVHALVDYPMQQRPALAMFFFAIAGALASEVTSSPEPYSPGEPSPASRRSGSSLPAN